MPRDPAYADTARALAAQIDDGDDDNTFTDHPPSYSSRNARTQSPQWSRRSLDSEHARPVQTTTARWMREADTRWKAYLKFCESFTPLQRTLFVAVNLAILVLAVLVVVYHARIFGAIVPAVKKWRNMRGGWLIMWLLTFGVAFPPLIGYSTCITVAGLVWGMHGYWIVATASALGSTASFVVSRTLLKGFVGRLTKNDRRFAALSLVLKHDGLKLLVMIRLCPLPYSLSNGAISTIPSVTWYNFMLATAAASPKLLLGVFVGRQLGQLAENGDKMDLGGRIASYVGITIGILAGIGTGYFIYVRTQARAAELEAEEAVASIQGRRTSGTARDYIDDPDEEQAVGVLRRPDEISLHETYDDIERHGGYRDDFTDDEDAQERDLDVFADGDGDDGDVPTKKKKKQER